MNDFKPTEYSLLNVCSGRTFEDTGWLLDDPLGDNPSLIRAQYKNKQLSLKSDSYGLYRYCDWMPVGKILKGSYAPITYRSEGLGKHLGIKELYLTVSGYYPEKGALMTTCSFKETEAYSVGGRMGDKRDKVLVVASAGNTARAFAKVCSDNEIPLLLCVPEDNLNALWFEEPLSDCVKLIAAQKGGDYFDAIHLSNLVLASDKFYPEGGAKNIARRDGMATTTLSAATYIGAIPDYYFQAVGSGTGAIAAWEANMRLVEDGRFGNNKMKLVVSQNSPFIPMYNAWRSDSRLMPDYDEQQARLDVEEINAKVLSNRKPPYGICGGLYDALKDSGGNIVTASNKQATDAAAAFERLEGIDIHPAAAIAVASLMDAVEKKTVNGNDIIMLNITGAGERRFQENRKLHYLEPSIIYPLNASKEDVVHGAENLFR